MGGWRRGTSVLFLFAAILAAVVIAGCGGSGGTVTTNANAPTAITAAPEFSSAELYEHAGDNWISNGGGTTNDRFSTLDEINTENVKELKGDWMKKIRKRATGR